MPIKIIEKSRGRIGLEDDRPAKYKDFLGHELTREELRLVPYVQYCAVNQQQCDRAHMDATERSILNDWVEQGFLEQYPCIIPTREFWGFMCDVLLDFYVHELVHEEGEEE